MGRHSRKGPAPKPAATGGGPGAATGAPEAAAAASGGGRRRRGSASAGYAGPDAHAPAGDAPAGGAPYPAARGGHPEHREAGGGWGERYTGGGSPDAGHAGAGYPGSGAQARVAPGRAAPGAPRVPGPRREFLEAFDGPAAPDRPAGTAGFDDSDDSDDFDAFGGGRPGPARHGADAPPGRASSGGDGPDDGGAADDEERSTRGGKGRTFTGVAAAAVTTVLAVVVAGQVADGGGESVGAQSAGQERGPLQERPDRSEGRPTPPRDAVAEPAPAAPVPTYRQLLATQFPLDPKLEGPGTFEAVKGFDKAPGKGRKVRYRIDVEKGLGLDAGLFARAVQETLNDDRSWAHNGAMTFERISSGEPEFVITLASPGTTGVWCAKSGLDTTVDNVSCDSASTERVMINAFRWARGADTFGPGAMTAYRQMLINHEVGHRLGYNHVNCSTPGALAPVMQQQTKSLDIGGISCRPNPWVHPGE